MERKIVLLCLLFIVMLLTISNVKADDLYSCNPSEWCIDVGGNMPFWYSVYDGGYICKATIYTDIQSISIKESGIYQGFVVMFDRQTVFLECPGDNCEPINVLMVRSCAYHYLYLPMIIH